MADGLSVTVTGAKEAAAELGKIHGEMKAAIQHDGMRMCGDVVKGLGAGNAPKGATHRLSDSWSMQVAVEGDSIRLQVGPVAPYARRNVLGYRGKVAKRASKAAGRTVFRGGRGRNATKPHRAWWARTEAESSTRFTGIIATVANPSRLRGGSYG